MYRGSYTESRLLSSNAFHLSESTISWNSQYTNTSGIGCEVSGGLYEASQNPAVLNSVGPNCWIRYACVKPDLVVRLSLNKGSTVEPEWCADWTKQDHDRDVLLTGWTSFHTHEKTMTIHCCPVFRGDTSHLLANYCPVGLMGLMIKVFKKLGKKAIVSALDQRIGLYGQQYSFRQHQSCLSNMLVARDAWGAPLASQTVTTRYKSI